MIKNSKIHTIIFLTIIFTVALCLRFINLNQNPFGLNRDEAAIGYNAYLISQTGQDEWGKKFPLIFDSFGDAKLPGYIYSTVLSFTLFGTQDWAVRFASALAGSLLVLAGFYLCRQAKLNSLTSLLFSFLIAIAPFTIFYSRMAFEANLALLLFTLFLGLILKTTQSKHTIIISFLAGALLLLGIFTYNTPLIIAPFLIIAIPFLFSLKNWRQWLWPVLTTILALSIGLIILLPLNMQKSGISIFSDEEILFEYFDYHDQFSQPLLQKTLGSKYPFYLGQIFSRFINSFSPQFLICNQNGHPWHAIPGFGQLTCVIYMLGLIGFLCSIKNYLERTWRFWSGFKNMPSGTKFNYFLQWHLQPQTFFLYLFFVSLIPAVITVDAPHATRSLLFLLFWLYFAALALAFTQQKLQSILWQTKFTTNLVKLFIPLAISLLIIFDLPYLIAYFKNYPAQSSQIFGSDLAQILQDIPAEFQAQPIAIVDPDGYLYITLAWDLKIDPTSYLGNNTRQLPNQIGLRYGEQVLNYHFIAAPEDRNPNTEKVLIEKNPQTNLWEMQTF